MPATSIKRTLLSNPEGPRKGACSGQHATHCWQTASGYCPRTMHPNGMWMRVANPLPIAGLHVGVPVTAPTKSVPQKRHDPNALHKDVAMQLLQKLCSSTRTAGQQRRQMQVCRCVRAAGGCVVIFGSVYFVPAHKARTCTQGPVLAVQQTTIWSTLG